MGNHFGYTISGPPPDKTALPVRVINQPSVRREPRLSGNNLRHLFQNPALPPAHSSSLPSTDRTVLGPATPVLPPTPPNVEGEVHDGHEEATPTSEVTKARSMLVTPVNQISPPTPDNTPPREKPRLRPFLGPQPSMTSTHAESFRTAPEDMPSDKESIASLPTSQPDVNRSFHTLPHHLGNGVHKPSPLANIPITNQSLTSKESTPIIPSSMTMSPVHVVEAPVDVSFHDENVLTSMHKHAVVAEAAAGLPTPLPIVKSGDGDNNKDKVYKVKSRKEGKNRERSLRERLEDSREDRHNSSVDKFASIIGWTNEVRNSVEDHRRWSGTSNTSTIEAIVIEKPCIPRKRHTLRHVSKNDSLRSASSPLPDSNRNSMQSSSDSPHRLIHKKAKLSNHNRFSFGSEVSRSFSIPSNSALKPEVITVAVIPERSSSLQQSAVSSRRHSQSTTGAPTSFRMPRVPNSSHRQPAAADARDRSRDRYYPPSVPPRASSLSAPTSRNASRANSVCSDHVQVERRRAEQDLRTTLDKMASERLASSLKSVSLEGTPLMHVRQESRPEIRAQDFAAGMDLNPEFLIPGTKEWADLRPTSTLYTPFSQPSFASGSPEISEAKMISLHPHNNHSVQLIEPFPLQESYAVEEARLINHIDFLNSEAADSPLRRPRTPPVPPSSYHTPSKLRGELAMPLTPEKAKADTSATPQRPTTRPREDSFAKQIMRTVSLKHARNRKADQDLDSSQHPFWRPRPFWDGIEPVSPEKKRDPTVGERGMVNNSLGLPQQRVVVTGPLELVRKFSERRRNRKTIAKQSSYNSLQRLRAGRRLHRLPGLNMHLQLMSFKDVQERINATRQKKEDEKREKRREALRKSIGPNVIVTGDSRFPATMIERDVSTRQ